MKDKDINIYQFEEKNGRAAVLEESEEKNGRAAVLEESEEKSEISLLKQHDLLVSIPEDVEEIELLLKKQAEELAKANAINGFVWLSYKDKVEHGQFTSFIKENGFNPKTIRTNMQVASFLLKLTDDARGKIIGLSQRKKLQLSRLDVDFVEEYMADDGADADELLKENVLSRQELQTLFKDKKEEALSYQEKLKNSQAALKQAKEHRSYDHLADDSKQPVHVVRARIESSHYQVQATVAIDDIHTYWEEYMATQLDVDDQASARLALQAYYFAAVQIAEHARDVVERIASESPEDHINAMPASMNWPKGKEYKAIAEASKEIIEEHSHLRERRAKMLANKFHTGAGRKFKVED